MDGKAYIPQAMRTASDQFHSDIINSDHLIASLKLCTNNLDFLDKFKKALFYGKELPEMMQSATNGKLNLKEFAAEKLPVNGEFVIHGIIGVATEAGELLETLTKTMIGEQGLDRVNIIEELGDVFWYMAMICISLGVSFEEVMDLNIEKLKLRFPERFSATRAIYRHIDKERDLLEGGEPK